MKEFFKLSLTRFGSLKCIPSFLGCKDYYHYEQDNSENNQQQAYLQQRGKRMCGQVSNMNIYEIIYEDGWCFSKKKDDIN
jgi:hypothetical protein